MDAPAMGSGTRFLEELPEFTRLDSRPARRSGTSGGRSGTPGATPHLQLHEPTPGRAVIPPAILAARMQRYSVYLMVLTFALLMVNMTELRLGAVLWFAAGLTAAFALLCAVTVVILNAIAWNFARLREELQGGRVSRDLR